MSEQNQVLQAQADFIQKTYSVDTKGADRLKDGRYLPYGGGTMAWFENQGVLKSERGNNYQFHTLVDSAEVRQKLFRRWGEDLDRRSEQRQAPKKDIKVEILLEASSLKAETRDYSPHGMRLKFNEEPPIKKGDGVKVTLTAANGTKTLAAQVVWQTASGTKNVTYLVGIGFVTTSPEEQAELMKIIEG